MVIFQHWDIGRQDTVEPMKPAIARERGQSATFCWALGILIGQEMWQRESYS